MIFDDLVIFIAKGHDERINFWFRTKSEALYRMENDDLSKKKGHFWLLKKYFSKWCQIMPQRLRLISKVTMIKAKKSA